MNRKQETITVNLLNFKLKILNEDLEEYLKIHRGIEQLELDIRDYSIPADVLASRIEAMKLRAAAFVKKVKGRKGLV